MINIDLVHQTYNLQKLVTNLRAIWTMYEGYVIDNDEVLSQIETLLYSTGVMQE
tara:strand:+ start:192 stop:353 length:162 start_codon:yes stop_codon:yes gene_type:complete